MNNCSHKWEKGLDAVKKNTPFKYCNLCKTLKHIPFDDFINFEDIELEAKIRRIVKRMLNEQQKENN